MAKPEWGTKRICPSCGTRYYDMRKDPPTCPNCSTVFDPEALLKSRRARPIPVDDTKKVPAKRVDDEDTLGVDTDDEDQVVEDEEVESEIEEAEDVDVADVEDEDPDVVDEEEDVLLEDADELGDDEDIEVAGDDDSDEDR